MSREELLRGMSGDSLMPNELDIIDESVGLDNIAQENRRIALSNRRLGLGEDLQRAHDSALISPKMADVLARAKPSGRKPMKPTGATARARVGGAVPAIQTVRSVPVIPNELVVSNFQVGSAQPYRVDLGLEGRTDILIANMSQSVVWVNVIANVSPSVGQFIGVPLKAMSGANAFDGGVWRASVRRNKRFWAISVAGGFHLVVTIESAIRE